MAAKGGVDFVGVGVVGGAVALGWWALTHGPDAPDPKAGTQQGNTPTFLTVDQVLHDREYQASLLAALGDSQEGYAANAARGATPGDYPRGLIEMTTGNQVRPPASWDPVLHLFTDIGDVLGDWPGTPEEHASLWSRLGISVPERGLALQLKDAIAGWFRSDQEALAAERPAPVAGGGGGGGGGGSW
ncbi:MAG: hypothetical protein AB7G36_18820 [Candidatus Nanopelagicales bacterium]